MRKFIMILSTAAFILSGCKNMSKTQKGVLIGAGAGAAVGAGIGKAANNNTALGAILGAAVGGVAGGLIGKKMDKQAKEIEQQVPGAEVQRVGEGINITFDSGVLFETNSASLNGAAKDNLAKLTNILNQYPDTYVRVEGHTDNTGSDDYNMGLSEKRAKEVSNYLVLQQVKADRIKTAWYGESQPKADNETESGRALNRRVEFSIYANETMKEQAKQESSNTK
jgi:outer membrane protein OmpA-like peptidoglycan-associated protein